MEYITIPGKVKSLFSSSERGRMLERRKIIQQTFLTILEHPSPAYPPDKPIKKDHAELEIVRDPKVVLRGSAVGWLIFSAMYSKNLETSGGDYYNLWDVNRVATDPVWTTISPGTAAGYPEFSEERPITQLLRKILLREGIYFSRKDRQKLVKKLSLETVFGFSNVYDYYHSRLRREVSQTRLPIANLSETSIANIQQLLGINPVELSRLLHNL